MPLPGVVAVVMVALITSVKSQAQCPDQMDADVLILGAGMSGLGAAERLSEMGIDNFLIVDQRDQIGGRVQTAEFGGGIVELGPQWLLGTDIDSTDMRHPLYEFVTRCNIQVRDAPFLSLGTISYNSQGENITQEVAARNVDFAAAQAPDVVRSVLDALPEDEDMSLSQGLRIGGWNPRTEFDEHVEYLSVDFPIAFSASRLSYRDTLDPDMNFRQLVHSRILQ